jgi:hypothetical protein
MEVQAAAKGPYKNASLAKIAGHIQEVVGRSRQKAAAAAATKK